MERCKWYKWKIRQLQVELRLATSSERQTNCQIRMDNEWDQEDANADSVLHWAKTYLFPCCKFLNDGWMNYSNKPESLSPFVRKKMQLVEGADFRESWERVICPTIQMKNVTIRCNLNNEICMAYKGKLQTWLTVFVLYYWQWIILLHDETGHPRRIDIDPDWLGGLVKLIKEGRTKIDGKFVFMYGRCTQMNSFARGWG